MCVTDDVTASKEQKVRHETKSSGATSSVTSSVIYYSINPRENVIYLFYIWRHLYVCPLIDDRGQQPMKMHTEVTLLYNSQSSPIQAARPCDSNLAIVLSIYNILIII